LPTSTTYYDFPAQLFSVNRPSVRNLESDDEIVDNVPIGEQKKKEPELPRIARSDGGDGSSRTDSDLSDSAIAEEFSIGIMTAYKELFIVLPNYKVPYIKVVAGSSGEPAKYSGGIYEIRRDHPQANLSYLRELGWHEAVDAGLATKTGYRRYWAHSCAEAIRVLFKHVKYLPLKDSSADNHALHFDFPTNYLKAKCSPLDVPLIVLSEKLFRIDM
jgi:hypothetical protein